MFEEYFQIIVELFLLKTGERNKFTLSKFYG